MTAASAPIRVLVADDHRLFRAGLSRMLTSDPRFDVVGDAANGHDAIQLTLDRKPDVVLMDLQMPTLGGLEAVKRLKAEAPEVRVLVISAYADGSLVEQALASGAMGYVNKDVTMEEVASRILEVSAARRSRANGRSHAVLSSRELHVLRQVASGLSNKQIAGRLGISEKTVRNHLSRVFNKLRATNRTEAVMNAMRVGIQLV
ncbi:MAG TPA: response regulator transcription factor [Candidatus Dormibacteraeota bacterium]|nr:response regulator transcription factor [Candidatus Dormibacteraeota bacterium]